MSRSAGATTHRRAWCASLALGLAVSAHAGGWTVKSVPDPENGRSRCMLVSPRQVIDDGYTMTPVTVRVDTRLVHVATESDIDLSFRDVGLRVDEGALWPPDAVHAQQSLVFRQNLARNIEALRHGRLLYIELRFWPTWPTRGRRTVTVELDGFAAAFERLAAGC